MNRFLIAHTPLGEALWAVSLSGREALSSVYGFTVRFKSDLGDIDGQSLIGERCAIELEADRRQKRYLSGQLVSFSAIGHEGRHWVYEAQLAPKLWHASRRSNYRIWQNQTVPEIVYQVLGENAVRFDMRLKNRYKRWTYLVQYGETDLAFICRRLEHEGIYFWFEHAREGETLVLADHFSTHPQCPGYTCIPFYSGRDARPEEDHFDTWQLTRQVEPGHYRHSDYDFTRPGADLSAAHADPRGHLFDQYERYAYPGHYTEPGDGQAYAVHALERLQREQETVCLAGRARSAAPGHRFVLAEHPRADLNRELTIVAATYDIADNDYESRTDSTASRFHVRIEALPSERPWRPAQSTPIPRTRGVETAVVVGPPGEEIHTDQYGRIKVHFHWDRYGRRDGTDTCWIRVAHPWAGAHFGAIHLPRVGEEVLVDFEHGDPDRPIVTGRVYNAAQMPPWALPANKTQSGILTRSSPGGGANNANAIRFEDRAGAEQVWIHAERNQDIEVEHDETHWVGNDRTKTIDRDETTHVKRHRTETVDGNETITVRQNRTEEVDQNETISIHQNRGERVDLDETVSIGANRTMDVGKHEKLTVGSNKTDKIGKHWSIDIGASRSATVARNDTTTVGLTATSSVGLVKMTNVGALYSINVAGAMNTAVMGMSMEEVGMAKQIQAGRDIKLNAGDSVQITCGKSMISMDSAGTIKIVGVQVHIEGQDIVHAEGAVSAPPPPAPQADAGNSLLSGLASGGLGGVLETASQVLGTAQQLAGAASAIASGDVAGVLGGAGSLLGLGSRTVGAADAASLTVSILDTF